LVPDLDPVSLVGGVESSLLEGTEAANLGSDEAGNLVDYHSSQTEAGTLDESLHDL